MNEIQKYDEEDISVAEAFAFVIYGRNADIPLKFLGVPLFEGEIPCQD